MARGRKPSAKRVIDAGFRLHGSKIAYGHSDTEPPAEIAGSPEALMAWESACKCLLSRGDFDTADRLLIVRYAQCFQLASEAAVKIRDGAWLERARTGWKQVSPALQAFIRASEACSKLEKQLGIGPEARRSLSRVADRQEEDELTTFLAQQA